MKRQKPLQYPGCCCTLSKPLITNLVTMLPHKPSMAISIGCGTGLLEAIPLRHCPELCLQAIEVQNEIIEYLPKDIYEIVKETWDLSSTALSATSWMCVYPRGLSLFKHYLEALSSGAVSLVIWIGPRSDLPEYENTFGFSAYTRIAALSPYEAMISWKRYFVVIALNLESQIALYIKRKTGD